jgi:hypothetical protein
VEDGDAVSDDEAVTLAVADSLLDELVLAVSEPVPDCVDVCSKR